MLGVTLFDRVKGRVVVTAAGRKMIEHAGVLQNQMLAAYQSSRDAADGSGETIQLGIFSSVSPPLIAQALRHFEAELPRARVRVIEATQSILLSLLKGCELDAVVGRLSKSDGHDDLDYEVIYSDEFRFVCGPLHPLALDDRNIDAQDLLSYPLILAASGSALRQKIDTWFASRTGRSPRGSIETRSILVHLGLLAAGEHIGVLPSKIASFLEQQKLLHVLDCPFDDGRGAITFITRPEAPGNQGVLLLKTLLQRLAATDGSDRDAGS